MIISESFGLFESPKSSNRLYLGLWYLELIGLKVIFTFNNEEFTSINGVYNWISVQLLEYWHDVSDILNIEIYRF